jgi:exonuclease SbcC
LVNKNLKKLNQGEFELVKVLEKNKPIMKVIDHRNGSQLRTINSLSGGQSFLAAFSMGLSISEQLKTGNEKSFFFIDEGFGSLDNDTLQLMKQLIFQLRNENRIIGIISHVEELKECITQKICLEKSKNGVNISYM